MLFYLAIVYFLSFFIVLILGIYEIYKDTKIDKSSLTWGVLVGFLIALIVPVINTFTAGVMILTYFKTFTYKFGLLMDQPIIKDKSLDRK